MFAGRHLLQSQAEEALPCGSRFLPPSARMPGRRDVGARKSILELTSDALSSPAGVQLTPNLVSMKSGPDAAAIRTDSSRCSNPLGLGSYGGESSSSDDESASQTSKEAKKPVNANTTNSSRVATMTFDEVVSSVDEQVARTVSQYHTNVPSGEEISVTKALKFHEECTTRLRAVLSSCLGTALDTVAGGGGSGDSKTADGGSDNSAKKHSEGVSAIGGVAAVLFEDLETASEPQSSKEGNPANVRANSAADSSAFSFTAEELKFVLAVARTVADVQTAASACVQGLMPSHEMVARLNAGMQAMPRSVPPRYREALGIPPQEENHGNSTVSEEPSLSPKTATEGSTLVHQHLPGGWLAVWDSNSEQYYYAKPDTVWRSVFVTPWRHWLTDVCCRVRCHGTHLRPTKLRHKARVVAHQRLPLLRFVFGDALPVSFLTKHGVVFQVETQPTRIPTSLCIYTGSEAAIAGKVTVDSLGQGLLVACPTADPIQVREMGAGYCTWCSARWKPGRCYLDLCQHACRSFVLRCLHARP